MQGIAGAITTSVKGQPCTAHVLKCTLQAAQPLPHPLRIHVLLKLVANPAPQAIQVSVVDSKWPKYYWCAVSSKARWQGPAAGTCHTAIVSQTCRGSHLSRSCRMAS